MAYEPKVYKTSGGNEMVVASSGVLRVQSDGTLTLESGATLTLAGQALTSTGTGTFNAVTSTGTGTFNAVTSTGTGTFNAVTSTGTGTFNAVSSTGAITGDSFSSTGGTAGTGKFNSVTSTGTGTFNAVTSTGTGTFNAVSSTGIGTFDSVTATGGTAGTGKFQRVTANTGYIQYVENATSSAASLAAYGVTHLTGSTTFTMPLDAPIAGVEKWICVVTTGATVTITSSSAGADIAGSTQAAISTGLLTSPSWLRLIGKNSTSWTVLGISANVTIA